MMRSKVKFVEGAAVGAAAAYVFDPDRGRARRARLWDQFLAAIRRMERLAQRRLHDELGRMKGRAERAVGRGQFHPVDDRAVAEHLRAVLARLAVPTPHLTTEVVDSIVRVRGEIASQSDAEEVLIALAGQPGVARVENLMHLPGEVPPNKEAVLQVSGHARGRRAG
jgi:gas vesicle protein